MIYIRVCMYVSLKIVVYGEDKNLNDRIERSKFFRIFFIFNLICKKSFLFVLKYFFRCEIRKSACISEAVLWILYF